MYKSTAGFKILELRCVFKSKESIAVRDFPVESTAVLITNRKEGKAKAAKISGFSVLRQWILDVAQRMQI